MAVLTIEEKQQHELSFFNSHARTMWRKLSKQELTDDDYLFLKRLGDTSPYPSKSELEKAWAERKNVNESSQSEVQLKNKAFASKQVGFLQIQTTSMQEAMDERIPKLVKDVFRRLKLSDSAEKPISTRLEALTTQSLVLPELIDFVKHLKACQTGDDSQTSLSSYILFVSEALSSYSNQALADVLQPALLKKKSSSVVEGQITVEELITVLESEDTLNAAAIVDHCITQQLAEEFIASTTETCIENILKFERAFYDVTKFASTKPYAVVDYDKAKSKQAVVGRTLTQYFARLVKETSVSDDFAAVLEKNAISKIVTLTKKKKITEELTE